MKRKFLSILLTLTMALTLLPTAAMAEGETETLQSQIATSGTVTLDKDYTEDITIPANANITLDLNGETLSNTNSGKATLSVEGTAVVKNGTISGGTGYYNIEVKAGGSLTLEDVTATAGNNGSSMIDNWGTLTITSGTYTGGLNVVKSEEGSTLMINGGKFTLNYSTSGYTGVILNYGTATITDGEFIQNATSGRWNHPQVVATGIVEGNTAITKITGGTFTNNKSGESIFHGIGKATSDNFEVSGGNFNKSVSSGYLKDGFVCEKDSATNTYKLVTGATGVTLSESEKTIKVGESFKLEATLIPEDAELKSVEWKSSDKKIATVNKNTGTVKGVAIGDVTITATPNAAGATPATCTVHVYDEVAQIDETKYPTIEAALAAAQENDTITLLKNAASAKTLQIGKSITLDLGDYKFERTGSGNEARAIYINDGADVTIKANEAGGVKAATIALQVNAGGKLTIQGGTYEAAYALASFSSATKAAYTTIVDGVFKGFVYTNGNGHDDHITINGGTYNDMLYLASGDKSTYVINDGTFNTSLEIDAGKLDIMGGTFKARVDTTNNVNKPATNNNGSGAYVGIIVICKPDGTSANGYIGDAVVNIKGGTFENTFANGETIVVADFGKEGNDIGDAKVIISDDAKVKGKIALYTSENNTDASFTVTGGYFTSDPSAYLAANKGLVTSDQSAFAYKVGDKVTNVETAVTAGEATVTIPADVSGIITEAAVKDAAKAADTTKTLTDTVAASGMTNDPAVVGTKKAAEAALVAENIPVNSGDTVTVVVQPYLEVNVKSADAGKLTLEISAKYNVVATTDDPTTIAPAKTATLKSGVPLSINKPIELTIALPTGFATASSIYVQHKGYEYTATVDASGATATFINPHGFSTFTVTPTASAVAEVDGTNYTDLQKAVDAVSNNGTVKLLNDTSASAVVSRAVKFTLDKNSKSFTGAITAGSGYKLSVDGDVYTFTVRSSSGSSGGSSSSSRRYDVSAPSVKHGDVTVSPKTASKGDTVTITVKPDSGYELDTLTVKDASGSKIKVKDKGDGKFTFTMPASKVTVSAEFAEIETLDFADVPTDAYYYEAVKWAAKKGITGGTGDGTFNPNGSCTRAHIVTFLWRAAGSPEPKSTVSFADVPAGSYYAKAVAWAVENGITLGTGDGTFSPNATCTRAQSVTFLYRALGTAPTTVNGFTDVTADAFYADAVAWAVESGVTNGTSASTFSPNNGCTRAQIVTFLYRTMK